LNLSTINVDVLTPSERDRILRAMADLCAERGYANADLEAVLERAEVDHEDFDAHFSGKEDCAVAAVNSFVSESLAAVSMVSGDSEPERRRKQIKALVEVVGERPGFAQLAFIQARQAATPRLRDTYESAVHVLALMAERASRSGSQPPSSAARGAMGGPEAIVRRELTRGNPSQISRYLPDFVYAALVPFVGQREALRQAKLATTQLGEEE
jgi:AcrR family transcriptional regulator